MDSSSQSNDFVVGNCIGCNGLVRVPSNTKANVRVRCPRCDESYLLSAILDHDIPALEVVDEPIEDTAQAGGVDADTGAKYQPVTEQENGRFVVPSYLAKAAERKPRRRSGLRESEFQPGVRTAEPSAKRKRSRERGSRPERSRNPRSTGKRNPVFEFIMIVLGGLMSLPVAQLMVWWILGTDPVGIAPEVSKVVPIMVPPDLRETEPVESGAGGK